jgi:hypothetical protein
MAVFWVVAPCNLVEVYHPEDSHLRSLCRENSNPKKILLKSDVFSKKVNSEVKHLLTFG